MPGDRPATDEAGTMYAETPVPKGQLGCFECSETFGKVRRKQAYGSPGWIRTSDHPINSRMLYR